MDWKGARKQSCHNLRYYPIPVSSRVSGKLGKKHGQDKSAFGKIGTGRLNNES